MKRILYILILITIFATGCSISESTPTMKVEEYMSKYQNLDSTIINKLDDYTDKYNPDLTDEQKKDYKSLLQKQYQNLEYKITDEKVEEDYATVEIEIEVFDYRNSNLESEKYIEENKEQFLKKDDSIDQEKYNDYKIKEMKKVVDKKKYNITFTLHKNDNTWKIDDLKDTDIEKIHGLYQD
ncbi:MAG: hypothetical protein J6B89_00080 [Bacilli bacterium]|nr:hypothetical protein [Bacilli bacterium]